MNEIRTRANSDPQWSVPQCPDGLDPTNSAGLTDFLLSDLDLALTFMDVADTTGIEETAHRNHENARKAYDTVLDILSRLTLKIAQRDAVESRLAVLKSRLESAGYEL